MLLAIVCLANAYTKPLIVDSLIEAWSHWLSSLVGNVTSHLRGHWSQGELILTSDLSEVRLATKRRNRQLKGATSGLRNLLSVIGLLIGCLRSLKWDERSQ